MKYYIIINKDTLELAVVDSKNKPKNSVLVTDDNIDFIIPKANNILFTEVVEGADLVEYNAEKTQQYLESLNQLQFEELSKTDWVYIRERELGIEVPLEIKKQRQEIREKYNTLKQQIK